jgi:hypothetical protein
MPVLKPFTRFPTASPSYPTYIELSIPGRPFRREVHRRIKEAGGFQAAYERVAEGETLASIAKSLGCSRDLVHDILTQTDDRRALYENARRESASAHAEKGLEIIDAPLHAQASNADVQLRKERANYRKWLASKLDRDTFGDTPLVQVNTDNSTNIFARQYLDALRAPVPSGPSIPVQDAEILEVTDGVEARQIGSPTERPSDQDQREPVGVRAASGAEEVRVQELAG